MSLSESSLHVESLSESLLHVEWPSSSTMLVIVECTPWSSSAVAHSAAGVGATNGKGFFFSFFFFYFYVGKVVGPFRRHPRRGNPHQGHPAGPRRKPRGDPGSQDQDSPRLRALLHAKSPSRSGNDLTSSTSNFGDLKKWEDELASKI